MPRPSVLSTPPLKSSKFQLVNTKPIKDRFCVWRPRRESNPRIEVLQTPAFPLRHVAVVG
jgi:hypothetical protein